MRVTRSTPGEYVAESPVGVRHITGEPTSITAFVGRAYRGPCDEPVRLQGFGEYVGSFGGLWAESTVSYAVHQYFLNGGREAVVVRVHNGAVAATLDLAAGSDTLTLRAVDEGSWGNDLAVTVDHAVTDPSDPGGFNLTVLDPGTAADASPTTEVFRDLSVDPGSARSVTRVLEAESQLVRVHGGVPSSRPDEAVALPSNGNGADGAAITDAEISHPDLAGSGSGLWALERADLFNLLCIPPLAPTTDIGKPTRDAAAAFVKDRRAMLLLDAPAAWAATGDAVSGLGSLRTGNDENVAVYFPRIVAADPQDEDRLREFAACGAVAGVCARTDRERGVWKSPAGTEAELAGAEALSVQLTDAEQDRLNPLGLNCLRIFPTVGPVVWGARTLRGADTAALEWKYVPVRRLALHLEQSLSGGIQWAVFEPNDEALWGELRLNIGAFLESLFRQGAFQGSTPREAYFVKCDAETTTQADRDNGIVNVLVGFAPLKPAEFVVIEISQATAQVQP